ncbi:MAG: threonylcarbamoyl-AMP synthase [Oscillospiraceae bacterium]|jgi:tRNA threonylcarbamoyl adenosine modification protein (Sua5/YciO/YrdC/YwlC family)/dephospho-CoA kinase|nr:threonylcarbamoyl-AMP synthase [Oscillospiraceae bacterium]
MLTVPEAAKRLENSEIVIVPTETVYGIAANVVDGVAMAKLIAAKQRPDGKPFSLLVAGLETVADIAEVTDDARKLAGAFWPGPLTLILRENGGGTVGVRCPAHPLTLELLQTYGMPLACPSANVSGQTPPTTFEAASANFGGAIDGIDGGDCDVGVESTVLDLTVEPPKTLRRGAVTKSKLKAALGRKIGGVTIIGITGGTGAGKTTALRVLAEFGALVIDCDAIYHELLRSSTEMLTEIANRFDGVVTVTDAQCAPLLNRQKLGEIVFADADALADLNAITHKYVSVEVERQIRAFDGSVAAVDAIALLESGLAARCDVTFAVTAPSEVRAARIMERDGIDEGRARARIAAQKTDEYFKTHCDAVLENNTDENAFAEKCRKYFTEVINNG